MKGCHPKHLLWALLFLKVHRTKEINCSIAGWACMTTISKWAWHIVRKISGLKDKPICLQKQFDGLCGVAVTNCFTSTDGSDCPVFEPWPFDKKMHAHKLNGSGVRHEMAVCVQMTLIVQIDGPFMGGKHCSVTF